jgi:signal transduction histidine kinase
MSKASKESMALLQQVLARISHDLSNALTTIQGNAMLLKQGQITPEKIERIVNSTEKMVKFALYLKNFSSDLEENPEKSMTQDEVLNYLKSWKESASGAQK